MKQHGATMITDQVFLGTGDTACDGNFIKQNYVTHILNTSGRTVPNVYDPLKLHNREVRQKLDETKQVGSKLIGTIQYLTLETWAEHRVDRLDDQSFLLNIFQFIESAVASYSSCLIVSQKNRCSTIVIAIIYCVIKYKWSIHKTLEYINGRKADIEITKSILKQLKNVETVVQKRYDL